MPVRKGKSLELFFVDGSPDGMLTATIPFQWSGHVLLSSRTQLRDALKRTESTRPGVYLLVGEEDGGRRLYIGESDDIGQRIKNHDAHKDWWTAAIFITSSGEQLNKAHIRYLESRLIERAKNINKVALENNTSPTLPSLSEAAIAHMEDFLENIFLVLPALKFDFFIESARSEIIKPSYDASIPLFELSTPKHGVKATARIEEGDFIVDAGSVGRRRWEGDISKKSSYSKLFSELVDQGILKIEQNYAVFSKSYAFNSPSAAGAVLNGRSTNGQTAWRLKGTNKTYKDWEYEQLKVIDA